MHSKFHNTLLEHFPEIKTKKILLAVSGGIDSMVLVDLFRRSEISFGIAHCNFKLRNEQSDLDQKFVEKYCDSFNIPFFTTSFDTQAFSKDFKLSTQIAARKLRYEYFYEILESQKYDFVATAHHLDDSIETFLINLSRGTGIDGLTGIPLQNEKTIRPLLCFDRNEILNYANENNINWREDASNATDYYIRNKIRHHLTPILREINPSFSNSFQQTLENLQQAKSLVYDASRIVYKKVVEDELDYKKINITELKQLPNFKAYLYQWLHPLGFTAWEDINNLAEAETGKQIFSENYQLLKNRNFLIIAPKSKGIDSELRINRGTSEVNFHIKLLFCKITKPFYSTNTTIFVDDEKLNYPLTLRRWKSGDVFQPLGMNGKSKKVSKLFKDDKLSRIEKENAWLLCSGTEIVWIVGIRADERFKINNATNNILQIDLI
ncbi:tRNA lysidine(34) synthetase TilS [Flavobacterium antarcticum]|uniref:tRNA lysidine(34) synthetase TilS n=1 Tax=Flavobacterium antarcticum TaxID=271155 RepID=UPI0003B694D4|nr:tRNA lysidine(34) synthetase TilS [Flavobacterium antarcticum]